MSSRDPTRDFFSLRWASLPNQPSRVLSTPLAIYNSESSKPNGLASPFRKKKLATFKSSHLASLIVQSSAHCSPCQNFHNGKDELADGIPTESSNRCTPTPAATRAPTPALAPVVAPLVVSGSANFSVIEYLKDDLQRIFKTVLDFESLAPVPTPIVAAAPYYEGPRERLLKAWFLDIYWDKTHLECYNFFQQCKDYFATASATGSNRVLFAAIFLKDTALFCWQQHKHKIED